jgi:NAD(P)-dependent dehydrogenase (short-subunit alcohol dehydrogenase family)
MGFEKNRSNKMDNSRPLDGRTALVTGATSGIGFYTARALAAMGAKVYITGRNASRGQAAVAQIREAAGHAMVYFLSGDASSVGGNQQLAEYILNETDRLHILVNNAGGLYNDRQETSDGYEASLGINFVGPFALTEALLPVLRQSAPARIVNVTSAGYTMWKGDPFADIQACQGYNGTMAYSLSKLLNLMWMLALARRLAGSGVVANALHPGTAWTAMTQSNEPRILPSGLRLFWPVFRVLQRSGSPEKAARTSTYLASAPEAAAFNGQYFESSTRPKDPGSVVLDQANQEKAWALGVSLVREAPTALRAGVVIS